MRSKIRVQVTAYMFEHNPQLCAESMKRDVIKKIESLDPIDLVTRSKDGLYYLTEIEINYPKKDEQDSSYSQGLLQD